MKRVSHNQEDSFRRSKSMHESLNQNIIRKPKNSLIRNYLLTKKLLHILTHTQSILNLKEKGDHVHIIKSYMLNEGYYKIRLNWCMDAGLTKN